MTHSAGKRKIILVVDDTEIVLKGVVAILERAGFLVLQASGGADALRVAAVYNGHIDLLLSDVTMPHMSGPELGEALKKLRPDMHAMFMSGFSGGDLLVLNHGWTYIQKPFVPGKLVEMIQNVMTTASNSHAGFDLEAHEASVQSGKAVGE